ncbi:hypothetical protein HanIR_Chr12g0560961 [Helianthus annuus]|nr:hypothetical protein HanIR_Chr12g0560961 [Helianthus annuus]
MTGGSPPSHHHSGHHLVSLFCGVFDLCMKDHWALSIYHRPCYSLYKFLSFSPKG